jgi:AcrR family transcriptional regulator
MYDENMLTDDAGSPGATRSRRRPRGSLNQRVILDAAFAVSERGGLEAVTFQALGAELGAHPTAVYRHFRDKDELLLAMIDALHAETLAELPEPTEDWAADLAAIARHMYAVFVQHPAVAAHASYRTARREHEFQIVERVIECMRRAGFDDANAARLYRVFADFCLGYCALDAGLASLEPAIRNADLLSWEIQYRTLPASEYPNIAAVAHALPALDDPDNFATAVDLMIEAIRARAAAALAPDATPAGRRSGPARPKAPR